MNELSNYYLKSELTKLLKDGHKITLDFNCGNDEALITPFVDSVIMDYNDVYFSLEGLIYNDLELPSAGEYMVSGTGFLSLEHDNVYLHYDLIGYTEIWSDDPTISDHDDYEPEKNIDKVMKDKYLLLSTEFNNTEKLAEFFEIKKVNEKSKTTENNFSNSDQQLWDSLGSDVKKPWWKFW